MKPVKSPMVNSLLVYEARVVGSSAGVLGAAPHTSKSQVLGWFPRKLSFGADSGPKLGLGLIEFERPGLAAMLS